jgi:hypothetical protein
LHERVTLARLERWARQDIDAGNRRFVEPLVEHAQAIDRSVGQSARIVLLGSIASDKYVRPLTQVFGERLLFPAQFVGRGDMSRGGLLLRAAQAGEELAYTPVSGAPRHGPRPPKLSRLPRRKAPDV